VRLTVGLAAEEYQLANAEQEAIERVRGDQRPDRDSDLVTWLGQVNPQPRNQLFREGVQALVWLRPSPGKPRYSHRFSGRFLLPRTDAIPFPAAAGLYCRWFCDWHLPRHGAFCSYPGTAV
jgi:hypothetical protein